ncbi:hypothetical protein SAMN06296273_1182 [Nitrosomonas ureae]|uniref:Phage regulatory protein CII (CP76) n=2 Tax=Nitrosomonas ureae TaxID=44577 RepID=A0A285BWS9_9PROT|nr:hypothetical protein SAMN06296273_1182 [Nitrosomonas ureae]
MNTLDVIHDVAHGYPGGVEALAARMGKSADTLRKKVLPTNDTHDLTVKELRKIEDYCNTDRIADAFANDRGLMCIKKPDFENISDKAFMDLFLDIQKKQGQWASVISESMESGDIDWDEFLRIKEQAYKYIAAILEATARLGSSMALSEENKIARSKRKIAQLKNMRGK